MGAGNFCKTHRSPIFWPTLACVEDVNENSQRQGPTNIVKLTLGNIPLDEFDQGKNELLE